MAGALPLTFGTLNVRGLRSKRRQGQLLHLLRSRALDVIAIQETKIESDDDTAAAVAPFLSEYEVCVSHAIGVSGGCMIFVRKTRQCNVLGLCTDREGRLVWCDVNMDSHVWRFLCVYAPRKARDREDYFLSLTQHLRNDRVLVVLGDFNCVCSGQDRSSTRQRHDTSADVLNAMTCDYQLVDVGDHEKVPFRYTHFQGTSHARLDRIYVSLPILYRLYGTVCTLCSSVIIVWCRFVLATGSVKVRG